MNLNLTTATRIGLNILALLAAIVALRLGESIFVPLVMPCCWPPSFGRRPPTELLLRLPWPVACIGAVMVLVVLNLVVMVGFVVAVPRLLQDLPQDADRQQELYDKFRTRLEQVSPVPLDPQYFPPGAEDSEAFKYVQKTLRALTLRTPWSRRWATLARGRGNSSSCCSSSCFS